MKHLYLTLFVILTLSFNNLTHAQVGVGTTTPDSSSILDIRSTNKGVLFPKVDLQGANTVAPLTNPAKGLIVWNTGTTWGTPGFYYNDSNSVTPSWVKIAAGAVMQNTLTNGKVWIGNATNVGTEQTMSGDFTMTNTGVSDISNDSVSGAKINIAGNTTGSLMFYDGTDWVNLAPDTAGKILITNGAGDPTWVNANTLNVKNIYTADGALTGARIVTLGNNDLTFTNINGKFRVTTTGTGNVAMGNNLTVTGSNSFVTGQNNTVSGANSTVSGLNNIVSGNNNAVSGQNNVVAGSHSNVSGISNNENGIDNVVGGTFNYITPGFGHSIVVGNSDTIAGSASAVFGFKNKVSAFEAFAQGDRNTASGQASVVFGANNLASGFLSYVLGDNNIGSGNLSLAGGTFNNAPSYAEISLGTFGTTYTPLSATVINAADRLINIGNGTSTGARADAFTILKSGFTGIGTALPKKHLEVSGTGSEFLRISDLLPVGGEEIGIEFFKTGGIGTWTDWKIASVMTGGNFEISTSGVDNFGGPTITRLAITPSGNVGIGIITPGAKLDVVGNTKTTNFQMTSGAINGYILKSDATGNGSWVNPNTTLTKKDVITTTTGVSIVNGTSQVVGDSNVTINIATNSATSPGLVSTAAGQNTKVWGTDATGNPNWKDVGTLLDAQNGLRMDTTSPNASATQPYVELGGPLVRNTTITQGNFNYIQDMTGTGLYRINHTNTTAATNTTYPFGVSRAGFTDLTIGSDASYAYIQSWNSKPLQINSQGNNTLLNSSSGSVGIGTTGITSGALFEVFKNNTDVGTWYGEKVYRGSNNGAVGYGVHATSQVRVGGGLGGTYYGVYGQAEWGTNNYGVYGKALFGTTGSYGVYGDATAATSLNNYGVYGIAANGSNNWAGYFVGNGYFSGNVGIGIITPSNKLDIVNVTRSGTHASGRALYVTGTFGSNNNGVEFRHDNGTQGIGFGFNTIYAAGSNAAQDLGLQSLSTGNLNFTTNSTQRMIILGSNGNIGMGTTSPAYGLDLNGTFGYGNGIPGSYRSRTETRDNAGLQATQSGFFETSIPTNYPTGATSWWHLIDVRHSNNANNYSMQIAGSFFDQDLYYRKTNGSGTQAWSKLLSSTTGWTLNGNTGINDPSAPVTYGTNTIATNENFLGTTDANDVVFGTNNRERMRVKQTNGFVGIGTASPAQNLQVTGNALTTGDMYIRNNLGSSSFIGSIHHGVNGKLGATTAFNPNTSQDGLWLEGSHDGESAGLFLNGNTAILWSPGDADLFRIYDEDVLPAGNPSFVIDGSGEVGIGVNAPVASLEIGGNPTNAFRTAYFNISGNNNSTTDRPYFRGGLDHLVIAPRTTGASTMYYSYPGDLTFGSTVSTKIQESIFISATGSGGNGNVGIGTATPGAKLDVLAGNVNGIRLLSGNATQYAGFQMGRATPDFSLGIAATAGNWSTDAAIGDVVIRTESTNRLLLQSGTGASNLMIRGDGRVQIGNLNNSWIAFADFAVSKNNNNNSYTAGFRNATNAAGVSNNGIFITSGQSTFGQTQFLQVFFRPDGTNIGTITQNSSTSIAYNTTSDVRLKTNLTESKYGLNTINKIQVKDYFYKEDLTRQQNGFIAQQLYEVYPHAVTVGGDDMKEFPWMVDYSKLTPPLVKAVQELSKENDDLKKVIENLTKRLEVLEQK